MLVLIIMSIDAPKPGDMGQELVLAWLMHVLPSRLRAAILQSPQSMFMTVPIFAP